MRPARPPRSRRRRRVAPTRSRPTVPRAVSALRRGREALSDVQGQLDDLLAMLREPRPALAADTPERLTGAVRRASRALSALDELRRLLP